MKHWKKIWNRVRRVRFKVDRKLEDHREDAGPVKTQGNGQVAPAVEQKTEDEMDRVRSENQLPAVQGRAKHRREKQPSLASVEDYRKLVAECNRAKATT